MTLYVTPETDSPIFHTMSSSEKQGGIQATIFLKRPPILFFYDIYNDDNEETVYLSSTNKGEFFDPIFVSKNEAVVMTLGVYLSILKFMKESWPDISQAIREKVSLLSDQSFPVKLAKNVTFCSDGHVVYERWFDECFFHYFESSSDKPEKKRLIHLQIQNKSIQVEPDVLHNMSFQFEALLNIVTRAGYIYRGPVSENIQLNHEP